MVIIQTNYGNIQLELDHENTPETAQNFLNYVTQGFYDNTIFHRVINQFMIQGGGMDADMQEKATAEPIANEADKAQSNKRGTIAMARTNAPHSATAQFFINVVDNAFLDHSGKSPMGWGYCVFGKVTDGMDVVDKIKAVATQSRAGHDDVPVETVLIEKAYVQEDGK